MDAVSSFPPVPNKDRLTGTVSVRAACLLLNFAVCSSSMAVQHTFIKPLGTNIFTLQLLSFGHEHVLDYVNTIFTNTTVHTFF